MRLLRLALMAAAVAVPLVIAGSSSDAACFRRCTDINPVSGECTRHGPCEEMKASVAAKLKPLRSPKSCRRSQGLLCDYGTCKPVCNPNKKS